MKSLRSLIFIFLGLLVFAFSKAQVLDFNNPASVCLQERIQLVNTSSNVNGELQWDFCEGELLQPLESVTVHKLNTIDQAAGIVTVQSAGNYYSFVIDRGTNSLHRIDYGTSLENSPISQQIVLPTGISLVSPQGFSLIRVSNLWYGFMVSTGNGKIFRLDFGSVLTNSPTVTELDFSGNLNVPIEVEIAMEAGVYYIAVANFSSNNLVVANLGNIITNQPQSFNLVTLPGASNPYGFSLRKFNDSKWRGIVGSFSNGNFHTVSFDDGLSQVPVVNNITSLFNAVVNPVKLALETWGDESVLQVISTSGLVQRVHFTRGDWLTSVASADILNPTTSYGAPLAYSTFFDRGRWRALTFSNSTRDLRILNFNTACLDVSQSYFSGEVPPAISFTTSGIKDVSLLTDIGGILERKTKVITVNNLTSPQVDYSILGVCEDHLSMFSSSSDQSISQYTWDFGDANSSTLANPTHQYTSPGSYFTSLIVLGDNGCSNSSSKEIMIYSPPVADFILPPGLICTNNEFTFTNMTIDSFEGNLAYQWLVNNEPQSNARDFNFSFAEQGDQQIKLIASIPGCSSELTKALLNVQTGPSVGFSFVGKCEEEVIAFTNQSTGAISGFQWSFGNANTSTLENPVQIYSTPGAYTVSLTATGTNGCASNLTKPITIYSVPQTNFSLDLPPFACSGSLSQFNDITPPMSDSNMATWAWSFGDQSNGNSSQKNPLYAYSLAGDYPVSLTTTTNFGCSNSVQKTVTIYPSPKADFSMTPACINTGTPFTDLSTGDLKSWLWTIQSNTYTTKNPMHTFNVAGSYTALLTVTGKNNCVNQISKNVFVPASVVADFESQSTCATKVARFQEISKGGADPAKSWTWNFAGQSSSTDSISQHTFPATGNFPVTMVTKRASGCSYAVTKMISVIDPPKAQFTVFLKAGAAPFPVDFVNTSSRSKFYTWKFGDAANTSSTDFSPSFVYSQLGNYTVQLEASNELGCIDTYIDIIQVVVPQINAAMADFALVRTPGRDTWTSMVTIENKSNVALINPDVYLDISGNALISEKVVGLIEPNASFTYTFSTSIVPRAVDFACAEIKINGDYNLFDNRQCVNLIDESISRSPYPNPASNELTLEWITDTNDPMNVIIYNASGQAIITRQYPPSLKGLNQVNVDVSVLAAGIYFVHYVVDGQNQRFKFSIAR